MLEVSVVVATRDRPERLRLLLAGLREQTLSADRFEVIVIDDGSVSSSTQHVLAEEVARGELLLRTTRHEVPRGPGGARNAGWRLAGAELVAFTDDDCRPAPAWLTGILEAAFASPDAVIQGRTEPEPAEIARQSVLSRSVCVERLGPSYETCNIAYPRALMERLEGFDEAFGFTPGGEDTDLAWRAIESGARTVFAPDAIVFHAVHVLGVLGTLREASRWTGTQRVFARHRGARAALNRGVFWNGWHYCVVRSLVALWLPRPVRRFLLTRHVLQLADRARDAGAGSWAVPFLLLYDVIEVVSVVRGGVRYRTFVV